MIRLIERLVISDWKLKAFSLLISFFIWLLISSEEWSILDIKLDVPIKYTNLSQNLTVVSTSTANAELHLKVPKKLESELKRLNPEISIDLSQYRVGQAVVSIKSEFLSNIPKGIEIFRITPSNIVLSLDKLVEKVTPVEPVIHGKVEDEKIELIPNKVRILCPSTLLPIARRIPTEPVEFLYLKREGEITVSLLVPDPRISVLDTKEVKIKIKKQ